MLKQKEKDIAAPKQPYNVDSYSQKNSAKGLLNILKKNDSTGYPRTEGGPSSEMSTSIKRNDATNNQESDKNSTELLNYLKPKPLNDGYENISNKDSSHELLNILHGNKNSSAFNNNVYATDGYSLASDNNENSSNKLLNMLQNRSSAINEPNFDVRSNGTSGSNELLSILHRK